MLLETISGIFRRPFADVLAWIRERSVTVNEVDWEALRSDAVALVDNDPTPAARYRAVRLILERLGDRHGALLEPQEASRLKSAAAAGTARGLGLLAAYPERAIIHVFEGGPAERAGVRIGDIVEMVNDEPPKQMGHDPLIDLVQQGSTCITLARSGASHPMVVTLEPDEYQVARVPWCRRLTDDVGYINIPPTSKSLTRSYSSVAHQRIRELDQCPTCVWIVDLRNNIGGNLYLMLAAVGPILGEGELGGLVDASGSRQLWEYRKGSVFEGGRCRASTRHAYRLKQPMPAVAVLTSRLTASAGEAVVVAFRGRPNTRCFGEPTAGVPTGLDNKALPDGGLLRLSTVAFCDRTLRPYCGCIPPDQAVAADWRLLATNEDPVVDAAIKWLGGQNS